MKQETREGFYQDKAGNWHTDRRSGSDRRDFRPSKGDHERRVVYRRKADRELDRLDHREVEAALDDFAEHHGGHL